MRLLTVIVGIEFNIMGKHFNERFEATIHTGFSDITEKDKKYKDGDPIKQKEYVNTVSFYRENPETGEYTKVFISKDFIIELHKQILSVEEPLHDGLYCSLPF